MASGESESVERSGGTWSPTPMRSALPALRRSLSLVKSAWHMDSASATSSARSARECSSQ
eukprot:scaffold97335_cov36-Phaeocystis_antarctica.AAC.1